MNPKHIALLVYIFVVGGLSGLAHEMPTYAPFIHIALPVLAAGAAYLGLTSPKLGALPGQVASAVFCVLFFALGAQALAACTQQQAAKDASAVEAWVPKLLTVDNTLCLAANFLPGTAAVDVKAFCAISQPALGEADTLLQQLEAHRGKPGTVVLVLDAGKDGARD